MIRDDAEDVDEFIVLRNIALDDSIEESIPYGLVSEIAVSGKARCLDRIDRDAFFKEFICDTCDIVADDAGGAAGQNEVGIGVDDIDSALDRRPELIDASENDFLLKHVTGRDRNRADEARGLVSGLSLLGSRGLHAAAGAAMEDRADTVECT